MDERYGLSHVVIIFSFHIRVKLKRKTKKRIYLLIGQRVKKWNVMRPFSFVLFMAMKWLAFLLFYLFIYFCKNTSSYLFGVTVKFFIFGEGVTINLIHSVYIYIKLEFKKLIDDMIINL